MKPTTHRMKGITLSKDAKKGVPTGLWRIDLSPKVSPTGKRARHLYPSKSAAQKAAREYIKQIEIDDHLARTGINSYTLNDVFPQFLKTEINKVKAGRKREASLKTDLNGLKHILDSLGDHLVANVDDEAVTSYQGKRKVDGVKPVTINTEVRKLRLMLYWCVQKRIIDQMPQITNLVEPPVQTEVPILDELMCIFDHLPFRHRVLTRLMCETGLRVSEAMPLRWDQVDLERNIIKVGAADEITPKTLDSYRDVIICEGLAKDLEELGNEHTHVFPGFRDPGKPMDNYRKALKTAVIKSGVKRYGKPMRFTPKFGRKAFTSYQWIAGVPLELIRQMIGHSPNSKVTVKNYLHMPAESVRAAVLDLDVLAKKKK